MSNIVAIVGRPNVGKSTLFNRLTQTRSAITDEFSGVTRDRNYGKVNWSGKDFSIIDTGGYVESTEDIFEKEIRSQVNLAIEESCCILFVTDVKSGVTEMDIEVANLLRKSNKDVILVVNKVDNSMLQNDSLEFYNLSLGDFFCISSINGGGTGDLLDEVVKYVDEKDEKKIDIPSFAIIGRPNAGKSSYINSIIGTNQNIVTEIAGTTRDSLDTRVKKFGFDFILTDTAGIRKKKNVNEDLEFYSVMRSIKSIERSDVCILLIDAERGFESQDQKIFHLADRNKKGIVILVNKWDKIEKETSTSLEFEKKIKAKILPFDDVPILFVSALTKNRLIKSIEVALSVFKNKSQKITTSKLNDTMLDIIKNTPPPAVKGKYIKIKYCTQLTSKSPSFVFFANLPQYIKESYKRFLENKLRENFNFKGVPISIYFRKK